jgi:hypothetical protein
MRVREDERLRLHRVVRLVDDEPGGSQCQGREQHDEERSPGQAGAAGQAEACPAGDAVGGPDAGGE